MCKGSGNDASGGSVNSNDRKSISAPWWLEAKYVEKSENTAGSTTSVGNSAGTQIEGSLSECSTRALSTPWRDVADSHVQRDEGDVLLQHTTRVDEKKEIRTRGDVIDGGTADSELSGRFSTAHASAKLIELRARQHQALAAKDAHAAERRALQEKHHALQSQYETLQAECEALQKDHGVRMHQQKQGHASSREGDRHVNLDFEVVRPSSSLACCWGCVKCTNSTPLYV